MSSIPMPADPVTSLDIVEIMKILPHRFPLLLVDRIVELQSDTYAIGLKNVTINEAFFVGHFPQEPVMPGVLVVESMAQTAGVLVVQTLGEASKGKLVYFMSIEDARFRRPITPGDQLRIKVTKRQSRGRVWKFEGEATVDGHLAAEAKFTAMIRS